MPPIPMAAADAQLLLLSAKVPNDQFLLYGFDAAPRGDALEAIRRNADACEELKLRVLDDHPWRYPRWVRSELSADQFVVHGDAQWPGDSPPAQLDVSRMAWRVHLYAGAVVVQMSHALGDGSRSAALAGVLLGRRTPVPPTPTPARGVFAARVIDAALAHRGAPPPAPPRPALSVNARPLARPVVRTFVVDKSTLCHPSVTVAALAAIAGALGGYLKARGEDTTRLAAEVPMAKPQMPVANNNFRNVGIGLHPEPARIAAEIAEQRRRAASRAVLTSDASFAAVPARLLRWGVGHFDPDARSDTVGGHTVVSSVNRGAADLSVGGAPVRFTAGFPALSPMMSLTHGVHGLGDTVAVSVHADPVNVDVDDYLDRLAHALDRSSGADHLGPII